MASQRHDDTAELQKLIDNYQTVDLKGKEYYVSRLLLRNNTTLRNGTIYSEGQKCVCYAENAHNITLSDLKIDGSNSSEIAVRIQDCSNVKVSNCEVANFRTIDFCTAGIYFVRVTNGCIITSEIHDIIGTPNGVIGDSFGASRALLIQQCKKIKVINNSIYNVISSDDGDGIHCIDEVDKSDNLIVIKGNSIKDCSRRLIKVQAPGVSIIDNEMFTEDKAFYLDYGISVYDSNVKIDRNRLRVNTPMPIFINAYGVHDIYITKNDIIDNGYAYQGTVSIDREASNIVIKKNNFQIKDDNRQVAVSIRGNAKQLNVISNKISGGRTMVWIRLTQDNLQVSDICIKGNKVKTKNNLICCDVANVGQVSMTTIERNVLSSKDTQNGNNVISVNGNSDISHLTNIINKRNKIKNK